MISADFNINIICYNVSESTTLCTSFCKSLNFGWSFIRGCSTISSTIIILYNIIHVITKKLQMFTF